MAKVSFKVAAARLRGLPLVVQKAAQQQVYMTLFMHGNLLVAEEIARTNPPPVSTGEYQRSWYAAPTAEGAKFFNPLPYAAVIEHGRRKGAKQPPLGPLQRWAYLKGLAASEEEARGIAFAIARKISREGLPAKNVLERTAARFPEFLDVEVPQKIREALREYFASGGQPS